MVWLTATLAFLGAGKDVGLSRQRLRAWVISVRLREGMLVRGFANSALSRPVHGLVAITGIGGRLPSPGRDRDHPMRATSICKGARFIKGLDCNFPSEEGAPFIPVHCE